MPFYNFEVKEDLLKSFNITEERFKEILKFQQKLVKEFPTLFLFNDKDNLGVVINLLENFAESDSEFYFLIYKLGGALALGVLKNDLLESVLDLEDKEGNDI